MLPIAILAGGLGTRLGRLTKRVPKSLVEVAGQPFIFWQLENLRRARIRRAVICVGHFGDKIRDAVGRGFRWDMTIDYSEDDGLGTGGALKQALDCLDGPFFVLYGDSYLKCDYARLEFIFWLASCPTMLAVYRNCNRWDRSNILVHEGKIQRIDKAHATPDMEYIDYGTGILKPESFEDFPDDQAFGLEEVYRNRLEKNDLLALEVSDRFYEIGSPEGYRETCELLSRDTSAASAGSPSYLM